MRMGCRLAWQKEADRPRHQLSAQLANRPPLAEPSVFKRYPHWWRPGAGADRIRDLGRDPD
jgi:hypothetical protein